MVKCNRGQVRRLKRALRRTKTPVLRQRIQMVLLREAGMTQPAIAGAMGVSLSTVNPGAHGVRSWRAGGARTEAERGTDS
jgi:hypothetical protein